jgi:micrococcal nuclease
MMPERVGPTGNDGRQRGLGRGGRVTPPGGVAGIGSPLLLAAALLLSSCSAPPANSATVLSVGDGDSLTVRDAGEKVKLRLGCLDSAELSQRPWGQQARQQLQALAPVGSSVTLKVHTIDRYGRTVAEVYTGGRNINLAMVSAGQAMAYRQYLRGCDATAYLAAERQAQAQRLGIWGDPRLPMAPWDFRRCRRAGGCR